MGLPITSSLMESTVKQLNRRIKGTEKFWTEAGGEAVLQLKADNLCDSDPSPRSGLAVSPTKPACTAAAKPKKPRPLEKINPVLHSHPTLPISRGGRFSGRVILHDVVEFRPRSG